MITRILRSTALIAFASIFSVATSAQESLVELIKDKRSADALELIASGVDVNSAQPDGSTALMYATYNVNHELVDALLAAGADADVTNNYGSSPLAEATKLNDAELVRKLLNAGADPDSPNLDNQTPLMLASYIGNLEIVEMLLNAGADVNVIETFRGQTALMWASAENHPEIAELLVASGADVSVKAVYDDWPRQMTSEPRAQFRPTGGLTALLYATRSGCYRCAVSIVEAGANINQPNPDGVTPLLNAIDNKSFDIAMFLIDQGAKVDVWDMTGRTPLYLAVDMNSFVPRSFGSFGDVFNPLASTERSITAMDIVKRLIDMGVDVNHQLTRMRPNGPGRGRFADYDMRGGAHALMIAVFTHDYDMIEVLLENGAEVDLRNVFRITPLMYAAGMSGNGRGPTGSNGEDIQDRAIKTINMLLDSGADVNAQVNDSHTFTAKLDTYIAWKDNEGRTALHSVAELGWEKVAAVLIERGADPTIVDNEGKTPLDLALAEVVESTRPGRRPNVEGRQKVAELLGTILVDSETAAN
ncbi:MAG: ankyrin repeat domain-containing protein [Gammaproteobacteria bacterium]|nr:ankyrin repeat domain-containing protein [Gammaproteobacteria bacterium]